MYCDWLKENFGIDVMGHVSSRGSYPNLWSLATFGATGATAGSCITLIACRVCSLMCTSACSVRAEEARKPPRRVSPHRRPAWDELADRVGKDNRIHRLTCSRSFELTKLSAQVSVLMADKKNCPKPESHKIAASYQNKGTLKTLGNIVKHRGFRGLYTGFSLHLCTSSVILLVGGR